jgi:hypothetical protein
VEEVNSGADGRNSGPEEGNLGAEGVHSGAEEVNSDSQRLTITADQPDDILPGGLRHSVEPLVRGWRRRQ